MTAVIQPETIEYIVPVNKQTKKPTQKYVVHADVQLKSKRRTNFFSMCYDVEEVENVGTCFQKKQSMNLSKGDNTSIRLESVTVNIRDAQLFRRRQHIRNCR